jgi:hypothetical protein
MIGLWFSLRFDVVLWLLKRICYLGFEPAIKPNHSVGEIRVAMLEALESSYLTKRRVYQQLERHLI